MIETLHALTGGDPVGIISWNRKTDRLRLAYDSDWLRRRDAFPLSLNLPFSAGSDHPHEAIEAFIVGLLPDNPGVIDEWAKRFQVSAGNPFLLLAHVGEDCAGAIQFVSPDRVDRHLGGGLGGRVDWLDEEGLNERIELLMRNHGATRLDDTEGQFSLAGAQPKIALYRDEPDGPWGVPSGDIPTTHILKPCGPEHPGHTENEHFCLRLARHLGMRAACSEVLTAGSRTVIAVERYDRLRTPSGVKRIHQEDMCQSLGCHPRNKYQRDGGPGAADILAHISEHSSNPQQDRARFIDALILNYLIAGPDAHGKNYSFLIAPGGQVRLAPLYDVASLFPYTHLYNERKTRLAMKIGNRYKLCEIGESAWEKAAAEWRMDPVRLFRRIHEIATEIAAGAEAVADEMEKGGISHPIVASLADQLTRHARREAARFDR